MTDDLNISQPVGPSLRPPKQDGRPASTPEFAFLPEPVELYEASGGTARSFRLAALVVVAVALAAAGLAAWFVLRGDSSPSPKVSASGSTARAASVEELAGLSATLGHPIFWVGPKSGTTYELTQSSAGNVYIRYLPAGTRVGAPGKYVTVATYPFPGASAALQKATTEGAPAVQLPNGGLAVVDRAHPESVHVAYPGVNFQIEVFDPAPGGALQMMSAGQLVHFGPLNVSAPQPSASAASAASAAELRSLANSLGHPLYWAGPRKGSTYELTQTSTGKVYIRYLPAGMNVGASEPALTVATYPLPNAYAEIKRSARNNAARTIRLPGGGIAVVNASHPTSINLAFPKSNVQVEVYDPSPARARAIVSSGRIAALR